MNEYKDIEKTGNVKWNKKDKTFTIKGQEFTIKEAIGTADIIIEFLTGKGFALSNMLTVEELQSNETLANHVNERCENWGSSEVQSVAGKKIIISPNPEPKSLVAVKLILPVFGL